VRIEIGGNSERKKFSHFPHGYPPMSVKIRKTNVKSS
jgi:hypothetical protein